MRERSLIVNDNPVERRLLDQSVRGFGYESALALLDERGHVRALADIEAEAIRFAISHYRGRAAVAHRTLDALPQVGFARTRCGNVGYESACAVIRRQLLRKKLARPLWA